MELLGILNHLSPMIFFAKLSLSDFNLDLKTNTMIFESSRNIFYCKPLALAFVFVKWPYLNLGLI